MPPPALVAGALAGGAAMLGGHMQNRANARQVQKQMDFQERMANTSWQRGVADMRAAGLNPALAYEKGGADAPAGAAAQMEDVLGKGVSSAMAAKQLRSQLQTQEVQRLQIGAQADAAIAGAEQTRTQTEMMRQQLQLLPDRLAAELYDIQERGRHSAVSASRLYDLTPYERRLLAEELEVGRPALRALQGAQTRLTSSSAREVDQRIKLTDRMTPDAWAAWWQRNLLGSFVPLLR